MQPKPRSHVVSVKRLPTQVVGRVKGILKKRGLVFVQMMKNADHRKDAVKASKRRKGFFGRIVRGANFVRGVKGNSIILKFSPEGLGNAREVIETIRSVVELHNKKFKPKFYELRQIPAHVVHRNVILMPRIDAPSILEILGQFDPECPEPPTQRGTTFFEKLKKEFKVNKEQLRQAHMELKRNIKQFNYDYRPDQDQILLIGFEKGKFVFMPLMDLV